MQCLIARAQCNLQVGDSHAAIADAEQILKFDPTFAKVSLENWFNSYNPAFKKIYCCVKPSWFIHYFKLIRRVFSR